MPIYVYVWYLCVHLLGCVSVYMCMSSMSVCASIRICICVCTCVYLLRVHLFGYASVYMYVCIYSTCASIRICICVCTCVYLLSPSYIMYLCPYTRSAPHTRPRVRLVDLRAFRTRCNVSPRSDLGITRLVPSLSSSNVMCMYVSYVLSSICIVDICLYRPFSA